MTNEWSQWQQTIEDIKEWYRDNDRASWIQSLNPPADDSELQETESTLGRPFTDSMRAFYKLHNGEKFKDFWRRGFLPHGKILTLSEGIDRTNETLRRYWGCEDGIKTSPADINRDHVDTMLAISSRDLGITEAEKYTTHWFAFGADEAIFTQMVNLDSGRVFNFVKQDGVYFIADSFQKYVEEYASRLWDFDNEDPW